MDDLAQKEMLTNQHLRNNNKEEAVRTLYELIISHAKRKNFPKAEELREKLIQVDPLALSEIITSAEIIEEEKKQSRPKDHLKIWANLYNILSSDESNALFYGMKEGNSLGTEPIFRQGEKNTNLYFLNEGQLIMLCNQGGKEIAVKMFRPGEIIGDDTFFFDSLCTASLRTFTHAKFNYLEKEVLSKWKEEFPALEEKIRGYCAGFEKVNDLLKRKGLDRRSEKRYNMPGKGVIQVLNSSGAPVSVAFRGELSDISASGVCFYVRLAKKETARLLLGRKLSLKFTITVARITLPIDQPGTVVAVRSHPFDDYTVHVKFDAMLSKQAVQDLAGLSEIAEKHSRKATLH